MTPLSKTKNGTGAGSSEYWNEESKELVFVSLNIPPFIPCLVEQAKL